jgi:polyisoprenoid-binding protein YceI
MRLLAIPFVLATLVACAEDVGKDKAAATVSEVPAEPAVAEPAVPASATLKELAVDVTKSSVEALGAKITAQHPIKFPEFSGKVGVDGDAVKSVSFEVKIASLVADAEKLTEHLKKPDFLDAEKFPTATFTSTELKAGSDQAGATHTVTGDFTIHGVTKRISFPATLTVTPTEVSANSEFVINRQDFGVTYPGKPDDLVQDNVRMTIKFVAPRA